MQLAMAAVTHPHKQDLLSSRIPLFFPNPRKKAGFFGAHIQSRLQAGVERQEKSLHAESRERGLFPPLFFEISFVLLKLGGGERLKGLKGHQIVRGGREKSPAHIYYFSLGSGEKRRNGLFFLGAGMKPFFLVTLGCTVLNAQCRI